MSRASLVAGPSHHDAGPVLTTRHVRRRHLEAWTVHLDQHEVTKAPHRVDGEVVWLAPWAGIFDPGYVRTEVPASSPGLWTALASAVGSGAPADS